LQHVFYGVVNGTVIIGFGLYVLFWISIATRISSLVNRTSKIFIRSRNIIIIISPLVILTNIFSPLYSPGKVQLLYYVCLGITAGWVFLVSSWMLFYIIRLHSFIVESDSESPAIIKMKRKNSYSSILCFIGYFTVVQIILETLLNYNTDAWKFLIFDVINQSIQVLGLLIIWYSFTPHSFCSKKIKLNSEDLTSFIDQKT